MCSAAAFALTPPKFVLSDDVIPRKYTIEMTIDPAQDTFTGRAIIDVDVKTRSNVIWLNAKDITPADALVGSKRARVETAGGEFLALELDSRVHGRQTIAIDYRGKLDEKAIVGPYRKQTDGDWYVFTSFTPIDARRAFPCFDDPKFKTPWQMTIHVKRTDKAFTNARMISETEEPNGMKAVRFAETKPLPAEVVAFAVGPFDVYEGAPAGHGTPIRVITAKGHAEEGKLAAQASVDVLPRLEAYTGIPYPFGKLDHLAVPEFPFGATENPGLIVYRNRSLLAAPGQDTPEKARSIRRLQAHEVGHQWFGDLVTQASWDDVWLSEGFATWIAAKMMDEEEPPERRHVAAVTARERIMQTDDSPRTRPVRLEMHSRKDTENVYNQIVYQKGAAILLMLEGWLGEDHVESGLRAYLKKHSFRNASTADLEASLAAASGVDPAPVMDAFLNHTGVPTIRADCSEGVVHVEAKGVTPIPVCVRGEGVAQTCAAVDSTHREIILHHACPAWIYFNSGATGYYRTEWTESQVKALDMQQLSAAERLMLDDDLRAEKNGPKIEIPREK
ncbi:MAG TPA: M1 family metallopeptidase [Bryobacteraceae bacterium]|nr:M1 family metallopeptidase [Bryobacteraceae bacterium]